MEMPTSSFCAGANNSDTTNKTLQILQTIAAPFTGQQAGAARN
jgi:hypothetical protein